MKIFNLVIIVTILSLTWVSVCTAENWVKYFSNRAGYEFFIEKDNLVRINENEVQVWYKSSPAEGQKGAWDEWSELRLDIMIAAKRVSRQ